MSVVTTCPCSHSSRRGGRRVVATVCVDGKKGLKRGGSHLLLEGHHRGTHLWVVNLFECLAAMSSGCMSSRVTVDDETVTARALSRVLDSHGVS